MQRKGFSLVFMVALAILIPAATVDIPTQLKIGSVSLQSCITICYALIGMILWVTTPNRQDVIAAKVTLLSFVAWAVIGLAFYHVVYSFQNVAALTAFVTLLFGTATRSVSLRTANDITWLAMIISAIAFPVYLFTEFENTTLAITPRPIAMVLLFSVAYWLARSRSKNSFRKASLFLAILSAGLIAITLSRMALFAACLLFPLSRSSFRPRHFFKTAVKSTFLLLLISVGLWYLVTSYPPLQSRFFQGDTSITVGGIPINGTGRLLWWQIIWESFLESPWIGHGPGSSQGMLDTISPDIGHVHNDYLRLLHDYGLLGTALWLVGYALLLKRLARAFNRADHYRDPAAYIHLFAFLVLVGVAIVMATDNILVYTNVMCPAAIVTGISLAIAGKPSSGRLYLQRVGKVVPRSYYGASAGAWPDRVLRTYKP